MGSARESKDAKAIYEGKITGGKKSRAHSAIAEVGAGDRAVAIVVAMSVALA